MWAERRRGGFPSPQHLSELRTSARWILARVSRKRHRFQSANVHVHGVGTVDVDFKNSTQARLPCNILFCRFDAVSGLPWEVARQPHRTTSFVRTAIEIASFSTHGRCQRNLPLSKKKCLSSNIVRTQICVGNQTTTAGNGSSADASDQSSLTSAFSSRPILQRLGGFRGECQKPKHVIRRTVIGSKMQAQIPPAIITSPGKVAINRFSDQGHIRFSRSKIPASASGTPIQMFAIPNMTVNSFNIGISTAHPASPLIDRAPIRQNDPINRADEFDFPFSWTAPSASVQSMVLCRCALCFLF